MADPLSLSGLNEGDKKDAPTTPGAREAQNWLAQITSAKQRESKYREYARKIWDIYEANSVTENSFNILYSNTETLQPAVYGATPRPRVRPKWDDEGDQELEQQDELRKCAAKALERMLISISDPGSAQFSPFSGLIKTAVTSGLVAGRGLTQFRYEPFFQPSTAPVAEEPEDTEEDDPSEQNELTPSNLVATDDSLAAPALAAPPDKVLEKEMVVGDDIPFDRITFGYAATWTDLPWAAIEYNMTEKDVEANFGEAISDAMNYGGNEDKNRKSDNGEESQVKTTCVYAVWHKSSRTVIFVSDGLNDRVLKRVKDPLGLSGFYPFPEQLAFFLKAESLTPVPLYKFYEQQAKELNRVSSRINKVLSVLKARGLYDDTIKGLGDLVNADDGKLIAAKGVAALMQNGSLDKSIWMWPVERLIVVLQQLYVQRQQVKQVIYEITGVSDILRGASVASETATAQTIKNQWGSLRLRQSQLIVSYYARNCFRIIGEIAVRRFGEETWKKATFLPYPTSQEKMALMEQAKGMMQQAQQMQAMGQQIPPELMQAGEQLKTQLAVPSWGEVLAELNDNIEHGYSVDVETNSTLDADATEDKKDMADLLTALAQIFQSLGPAVQSGALPKSAAKAILMAAVQRYRFSDKVMEEMEKMPGDDAQPAQPAPDPGAAKAEAETKLLEMKGKIEVETAQAKLEVEKQKLELEKVKLAFEQEEMQVKHEMAMQKFADQKMERAAAAQLKQQQIAMQAAAGPVQPNPQGPGPMAGMQPQQGPM